MENKRKIQKKIIYNIKGADNAYGYIFNRIYTKNIRKKII